MLIGIDDVLNWLWQGCLVAIVILGALRLLERSRAQARYVLCWVALITLCLLPILPVVTAGVSTTELAANPSTAIAPLLSVPDTWWTSTTIVLSFWAIWSSVCCIRMVWALIAVRRARANCRLFPIEAESRLHYWNTMGRRGRRTRLVISNDVRYAAVLGCGSPMIGIAPALLRHLNDDQLDAVVIHEWAHVQRRDDIVNLAQVAMRAIAGWHPAVWWLERQLRIEREAACDEMAVAVTRSAKTYAASLTAVASLVPGRPQLLPALGALSGGLSTRISRIFLQKHLRSQKFSTTITLTAALLVGILSYALAGLRLVGAAVSPPTIVLDAPLSPDGSNENSSAETQVRIGSSPVSFPDARVPRRAKGTSRPGAAQSTEPTSDPAEAHSTVPSDVAEATRQATTLERLRDVYSKTAALDLGHIPPPTLPVSARAAVTPALPATDSRPGTPWGIAADGGIAVGRGSQKAALGTASFFTRFGKKIGASF